MTKVITRFFEDAKKAKAVERKFLEQRFPRSILRVFTDVDGMSVALEAANVEPATAKAYAKAMGKGGAVMLVKAGHKPLGVAQITRDTTAAMGAKDMGDLVEEVYVADKPGASSSVLTDHPLFLTREKDPDQTNHHMANWPIPLISHRKPKDEFAFPRHARMANFPIPLTIRMKPRDDFAFPRHARMANFPIPLTIRRKPSDKFLFPRHARMANFPLPLLSKRKPYTGSLIPRHQRMANWPFPHLINGKTGTNALMPGAPRMANFPIPLTSDRKPFTGSLIPRHGRMANFPISLISKRKPFTGSIFSKHARMANFPIGLLSKGEGRFSLSKMLGMPTIISR